MPHSLCFALVTVLCSTPTATSPGVPEGGVFSGRENRIAVPLPRADGSMVIDGVLNEPLWQKAALLTGFSQYQPVDGRPATDSTEVLVFYSPTAIHFGIRAFEAHGTANASLADRDRIFADDFVQIFLSTFNDGRQAYVFAVNPLGVQADGTLNEGGNRGSGFFGSNTSSRESADLSANFVFDSKGRVTEFGYEIEVRVPFKSLRFQSADVQTWGLNIIRQVQHLGHEDSWVPARRGAASFLGQSGTLTGLRDLHRGLVIDAIPEVVGRQVGAPRDSSGRWGYAPDGPDIGGNVRWGVTSNLTLNATLNPDFSQVEADVGALVYDPRNAIQFAERRPFFLDGIENFSTPNQLIYSRRVVHPEAAVKLTGKLAGTNVAFLSAVDDKVTSRTGDHPVYNMLRAVRDIGGQSRIGLVYTDKIDGDAFNRVLGADARLLFGGIYSSRLQFAESATRRDGGSTAFAPLWSANLDRNGRRVGFTYSINAIDQDFSAQSGFISRAGIVNGTLNHRLTTFAPKGSLIQTYNLTTTTQFTWRYDRFTGGESWQDGKMHFNNNVLFRGGWRVGGSVLLERFGYDDALYANHFIARPTATGTDTVAYTGVGRLPNVDWVLSVTTPQFASFSGNVSTIWGKDENFYEWSSANIVILDLSADWRPTDKVRVAAQYRHQEYNRKTDGSTVAITKIPRLKIEYQIARPVFFRVVGQYVAEEVDSLRDDSRTEAPILLRDPTSGAFSRATAQSSNDLRVDWLFSYQPRPGTVIFAGYGSSQSGPYHLRLRKMERTSDGFFVKVSYLLRA